MCEIVPWPPPPSVTLPGFALTQASNSRRLATSSEFLTRTSCGLVANIATGAKSRSRSKETGCMACVRELGASVFLMGPNAKVIAPSIVNAFATSGTELTAAMALIQTFTVIVALVILFRLTRGVTKELT